MFTGIVTDIGEVIAAHPRADDLRRFQIGCRYDRATIPDGASIACNGACLTVIAHDARTCRFQAGPETLDRTNLGELVPGDRVNLERSLRLADRLGGHLVQGHIDGVGRIAERRREGDWELVWFRCSKALTAQMVSKGSVAVDGVSLTLVDVEAGRFSVALIPHTLTQTTLGFKQPGASVNLETDLLAKYVWKCLQQMKNPLDT